MKAAQSSPQPQYPPARGSTPLPRLDSAELFASRREVVIEHAGECYRLRLTRRNKLILTK
jgi:hemin uptake protein HemP